MKYFWKNAGKALLLSLLYGLFNKTIMPTVTKKITDLFNFKG